MKVYIRFISFIQLLTFKTASAAFFSRTLNALCILIQLRVFQVWFQNMRARDRRRGKCIPDGRTVPKHALSPPEFSKLPLLSPTQSSDPLRIPSINTHGMCVTGGGVVFNASQVYTVAKKKQAKLFIRYFSSA